MKDEAQFKTHFKKSVRVQGGFSISLAAPMLAGTPDLYVAMPGFAPVLLEAKWLKEINENTNRQIPITGIQKHYLDSCNKVFPGLAYCLIGYKFDNKYWCGFRSTDQRAQRFASDVAINKNNEIWELNSLFELYVPKMQVSYQTTPLTNEIPIDKVSIGICNGAKDGSNTHT